MHLTKNQHTNREKITELKGKLDNSTITIRDFNTSLTMIDEIF